MAKKLFSCCVCVFCMYVYVYARQKNCWKKRRMKKKMEEKFI